jgi:hypothetical protein
MMNFRRATIADAPELAEMNWHLIRDEGHRNRMSRLPDSDPRVELHDSASDPP